MKDDYGLLKRIATHLEDITLEGLVVCMKAITVAADRRGTWCEGCPCHARELREGSAVTCSWRGRRGRELAAYGIGVCLGDLSADVASDADLRGYYSTAPSVSTREVRDFERTICRAIMQEWQDKLAFWPSLPHLLLGVFLPDDESKSKEVASRCVEEWDRLAGVGQEQRFHRVARYFLEGTSDLRAMLNTYIASDLPLKFFAPLYTELRSFAVNMIVSRRVEGMHSQVKCTFNRKMHCLVPRVSSSIRQIEVEPLMSQPGFLSWLRRRWYDRDWLRGALEMAFPRPERQLLKGMSKPELLNLFYQCSPRAMYREPRVAADTASAWKTRIQGMHKLDGLWVPDSVAHIVGFVKSVFKQVGVFWSLPSALFRGEVGPAHHELHNVLPEYLVALGRPRVDPDLADLVVFRVSCAYPEAKNSTLPSHVQISNTTVNVEVYDGVIARDGKLVLDDSHGSFHRLDLANISHWRGLEHLRSWPPTSQSVYPVLSPAGREALANMLVEAQGHHVELVDVDDSVFGVASVPPAAQTDAIARRLDVALRDIHRAAMELDGFAVPCFSLLLSEGQDVECNDLDILIGLGVLTHDFNEFGEMCVSLAMTEKAEMRWSIELSESECLLDMPPQNPEDSTKLQLMCALLRDGWQERMALRQPLTVGSPREFVGSFRAPWWYFHCMVTCQEHFGRGVGQIHHAMREAYYTCVCEMSPDALAALNARPDLMRLKGHHFRRLLKGEHVDIVEGAAGHARLAGAGDDAVAGDGAATSDEDLVAEVVAAAPAPAEPAVDPYRPFTIRGVTIKWDYQSHASRMQRGYIRCGAHVNCWRYCQTNQHPTKQHVAAYLYAWRELGLAVERAEHVSALCQPCGASVLALIDEVEM